MSFTLSALAVFSIVLCLAGCSETGGRAVAGEESTDGNVKVLTDALVGFADRQSASFADRLDDLAGSLRDRMYEGQDAFADAAAQTLEEIKKLEEKARSDRGDARKSSGKAAQMLLEQRAQLARQLETLRKSGDDAWEEIAEGFDKALAELSKELARLDQE